MAVVGSPSRTRSAAGVTVTSNSGFLYSSTRNRLPPNCVGALSAAAR